MKKIQEILVLQRKITESDTDSLREEYHQRVASLERKVYSCSIISFLIETTFFFIVELISVGLNNFNILSFLKWSSLESSLSFFYVDFYCSSLS